jgi:hypothetical protein
VLAARILTGCTGSPDQRLIWAWQHVLQRDPAAGEMKTMRELLETQLDAYRKDATAADDLLKTGQTPTPAGMDKSELAAWTHVTRVLLNLHETITRS